MGLRDGGWDGRQIPMHAGPAVAFARLESVVLCRTKAERAAPEALRRVFWQRIWAALGSLARMSSPDLHFGLSLRRLGR